MVGERDWRSIYNRSKRNRAKFKLGLVAYGLLVYWLGMWSLHSGNVYGAVASVLLASQIPVSIIGWRWEDEGKWVVNGRSQLRRWDPHTQSWAFLADGYGLMPMMAFAALAYPHLPHNRLFNGDLWWLWALTTLVIGASLAWVFARNEGDVYDVLRRNSLSKYVHNGVAFTVLAGFMFHWLIPVVWSWTWSTYAILAFAGLLLWLISALGDGRRGAWGPGHRWHRWQLLPENLHPQGDEYGRRIWEEIAGVLMWNEFRKLHKSDVFDVSDLLHTRRLLELVGRLLAMLTRLAGRILAFIRRKPNQPDAFEKQPPKDPEPPRGHPKPG